MSFVINIRPRASVPTPMVPRLFKLVAFVTLAAIVSPFVASAQSLPPSVAIRQAQNCTDLNRIVGGSADAIALRRGQLNCPPAPTPPRQTTPNIPRQRSIEQRLNRADCDGIRLIARSVPGGLNDSRVRDAAINRGCPWVTVARSVQIDNSDYARALRAAGDCDDLYAAGRRYGRQLTGPLALDRLRHFGCSRNAPTPAPTPALVPPRLRPAPSPTVAPPTPIDSADVIAARGWAAWQAGRRGEGRSLLFSGRDLLVTACREGSAAGCIYLGDTWDVDFGDRDFPRHPQQALAYYQDACELESAAGCDKARIVTSRDYLEQYNATAALSLFKQSGYRNDQIDCSGAAAQQCLALAQGETAVTEQPRDPAAVFYWTDRACTGQLTEACHDLAEMIFYGDGVAVDENDAFRRWAALCDTRSYGPSCDMAAFAALRLNRSDVSTRAAAACVDGGRANGCWVTGLMLQLGYGAEPDFLRAEDAFARSCFVNDIQGCRYHAEIHEGTDHPYPNAGIARTQRLKIIRLGGGDETPVTTP